MMSNMSRQNRHWSFDDNAEIPNNTFRRQRSEIAHIMNTPSDVSVFDNYDGITKSGELDFMVQTNKAGPSHSINEIRLD